MIREAVVASLRELADSLGSAAKGSEWHLFGSVDRNEPDPADIDLMILCMTDDQTDALRSAIDIDSLAIPLHLALFTFEEARKVGAVHLQRSSPIYP
jgi:predicted nucleotidyltransferase